MKILLINPPRYNIVKWTANDWELDLAEISAFPPLGLMYIASYVKGHTTHDVKIIDAVAEGLSYEAIEQELKAYRPDVVGISSFTYTFYDALKTAKLVRALYPSTHISIGGPHTSLFPEEMIAIAKRAGCRQILFGVEDYTDEGLRKIKKRITIRQAFEAVRLAKKYGIEMSTNWIMGLPNHKNRQDLYELVDTAIRIDSDYAQFSMLQLLPGCEMYDEAVAEGVLEPNYWKDYVLSPKAQFYVQLYTKYFGAKELSDIYIDAHLRYYRRFGYIFKRLLKVRSLRELKVKARAAMAALR